MLIFPLFYVFCCCYFVFLFFLFELETYISQAGLKLTMQLKMTLILLLLSHILMCMHECTHVHTHSLTHSHMRAQAFPQPSIIWSSSDFFHFSVWEICCGLRPLTHWTTNAGFLRTFPSWNSGTELTRRNPIWVSECLLASYHQGDAARLVLLVKG